ncbi:MAG: phage terminase large subunit [Clostridia bacterium]|nr:phage terminase large subunit [Clostridia bacterium]
MLTQQIEFVDTYLPLLLPNHSIEQANLFETKEYKESLTKRILSGEELDPSAFGAKTYIGKSGRSTGKTTNSELAIAQDIVTGKGDIWYCRSELGDIRSSIFSSMQSTIRKLGFTLSGRDRKADFYVCASPFEITHNKTGNKIQFFAINKDINRTKGFFPPSGKLQRIVVEEANEVDESKYITALETTANKYINSNSKFVYNLNPPETKQHWSVKFFDDKIKNGATLLYTTWEHLAEAGLLSPAMIADILKMKRDAPLFYRYWYLGDIVKMTGLVFPMFDEDKHVVHIKDRSKVQSITSQIIIAGDAANKNDPTAVEFICVLNTGQLLVLDAFYYDPKIHGQTDDVELGQKICDWFEDVHRKYPGLRYKRHSGTIDNANWNLIQMLQQSKAMGFFKWYPATDKMILRDVNRLRVLLRNDMLLFNVESDNQVQCIVDEFENFVYDEKSGEIKTNQSDHGIDATKYGTLLYTNTQIFF